MKKIRIIGLFVFTLCAALATGSTVYAAPAANTMRGRTLLSAADQSEMWYIHPLTGERHDIGRPTLVLQVMRQQGVGISDANLSRIPLGISVLGGPDSDSDGLSDVLEDAIGTSKDNDDTDGDGYNDRTEITNGFNPNGAGRPATDASFSGQQAGRIFLQVQAHGEAWWVNPDDHKRYFLGRPSDAVNVLRSFGQSVAATEIDNITVASETTASPAEQPGGQPAEQPAEQPGGQPGGQSEGQPGGQPAEQPAEQPPAEQPPAEQPPAEQPPAEQPPAEQPAAPNTGNKGGAAPVN